MGQLEDMNTFVRIIDAGGITRASEQMNIAKSAISRRLVELEERLGTQLLVRTTRQSNLTDAGQDYYNRAISILEDVEELNNKISCDGADILKGNLKISVPLSFGLTHLTPLILNFINIHPQLNIQVDFADRQIDLVEEGYDMAIRISQLKNSSLIARKLLPIRTILCSSPSYLNENGTPQSIDQLKNTHGLLYGQDIVNIWKLICPDGKPVMVTPTVKMMSNNGDFLKDAVKNGHGVALLPNFLIWKELEKGEIIPILTDYNGPELNVYAVYPQTRHVPRKIRLFIDYLNAKLEKNIFY